MPRCCGPAAARNAGADAAAGKYLVFIDADVRVHPDTLAHLARTFATDETVDAVFGSYDAMTSAPNFVSHYKNLFHHYVHQSSHEEASTFWSGCGAIKRSVFLDVGGFDPEFERPTVEDIELGIRLRKAGHRIVLNKQVLVIHAKKWTLLGMIRSDIWDRAIPWTRVILRERSLPNDLNLAWPQRFSALFALGLLGVLVKGTWQHPLLLLVPLVVSALILAIDSWSARSRIPTPARWAGVIVMLACFFASGFFVPRLAMIALFLAVGIVALNVGFYGFFLRERKILFASAIFPLHFMYYAYSAIALAVGTGRYLVQDSAPARALRRTPC
jgi:glycosyltransferase involved in cell wall biosynthesis